MQIAVRPSARLQLLENRSSDNSGKCSYLSTEYFTSPFAIFNGMFRLIFLRETSVLLSSSLLRMQFCVKSYQDFGRFQLLTHFIPSFYQRSYTIRCPMPIQHLAIINKLSRLVMPLCEYVDT